MAYFGQVQTYYNPAYPDAERWAAESWAGLQEYFAARETPESYAAYWQPTMDMMIGAVASDPEYAARVLDPASEGYNSVVAWIAAHPGSTLEDYFRSEVGQTLIASVPAEPSPVLSDGAVPLIEVPIAMPAQPVPLQTVDTGEIDAAPREYTPQPGYQQQPIYTTQALYPETPVPWGMLALIGIGAYLLLGGRKKAAA